MVGNYLNKLIANSTLSECKMANQILDIVLATAKKMSNLDSVRMHSSADENIIEIEGRKLVPWHDLSLSHGLPGLCILFGELDNMFPEDEWDLIGHSFMIEIQKKIKEQNIMSASTFSGWAGIGFAARSLSRNGVRYQKFIKEINNIIIKQVKGKLTYLAQQDENSLSGAVMTDYDVIEGLSGIGRYLLFYSDNSEVREAIYEIQKYLINITEDIIIDGELVPGWFISSSNQFLDVDKKNNPIGNFNCGLSHGIPGPMAFLSIAKMNGLEVSGQAEAIHKIAKWLIKKAINENDVIYFPAHVSWEEEITGQILESPTRDAWCYGTPGVSRALYLAGKALESDVYKSIAEKGIFSSFERNVRERDLSSSTFCHGLSGLLHITEIMNNEIQDKHLLQECKVIINNIMNEHNENLPFGFDDFEYLESGAKSMNKAGLLDGATGVLLSLLFYYNKKSYTDWNALFLLN